MSKKLELALRIKTDMQSAVSDLNALDAAIDRVGDTSERADTAINATAQAITRSSETADQQTARLREMVRASLAHADAQQSVQQATEQVTQVNDLSVKSWHEAAAAQTTAMQAHWDTVRAAEQQAIAEQQASEAAAEARAEQDKQAKSLNKLLGQLNSTEKALAQLDQQERELAEHFRAGRLDASAYGKALDEIKSRRNALQGQAEQVQKVNKELGGMPPMLKKIAVAIAAAFSVREIARATEAYTSIRNRLALVTEGSMELAQAQDAVFQIAQNARQPLEATAELYQRIATNSDELKISASGVAGVVETISKTLAISGASSQASSAAMIQLGQAFASGTLRGQELNSVLEQAPALAKALAAGLGVNIGELRKLGEEGKLTAENVIQALQSQGAAVDEQFSKIEVTGGQAMTVLGNSLVKVIGELNDATGAGTAFGESIMQLSEWLDSGVLTDGVIASFSVWSGVFDAMSQDLASLQLDLDSLADNGESTAQFLARAFLELPVNLRAMIQLRVVEILNLFDKAVAMANWAKDSINSIFTEKTQDTVNADLVNKLKSINDARQESIDSILQEREAILSNAEAQSESRKEERKAREEQRAQRAKDIAQLREDAKNRPVAFAAGTSKNAANQLKAAQDYVKQLEKQAATLDMTSAQLREYELSEKKLTGTLLERAQAAQATIAASEQQKQSAANAKAATDLQVQLLQASGRETEAALLESAQRFAEIQRDMLKTGNDVGLELVQQLIPLDALRVQLSAMQTEIDKALNTQQRREQSIEAQVNSGLITQIEGRKQLVELHRQTADLLEQQLPQLRAMAAMPGVMGEQARIVLETLETQMLQLRTTTNELQNALRDGLQNGIAESLSGLAKGTMDLRDAINALLQSVVDSMVQIASQQLAEQATSGLMSMVGSLGGMFGGAGAATNTGAEAAGGAATAAAITSASTVGATAMSTGITSAGGIAASAMTSAITTAGTVAAQAMATAIASAQASSAATNAVGAAAKVALATGGHVRGPGTGTSDSIPAWLSDYEFVSRAAVVKQPGALPFLQDFNQRGMQALYDWSRRIAHHSTGGLAGIPAPAFPAPALGISNIQEPAKNMSTTLNNKIALNLIDSPERIADALNTPAGTEALTVMLSNDPAKYRQILGVN